MAGKSRTRRNHVSDAQAKRDAAVRRRYQKVKPSLERLVSTGKFTSPIPQSDKLALMRLLGELRELRRKRGLSLSAVSAKSGIDKAALSRLENGRTGNPTLGTLESYARALDARVKLVVEQ